MQPPTPPTQPPQQPQSQQPIASPQPYTVRPVQPLTINGKAVTSAWVVGITLVVLMVFCGCFGSGYAMGMSAPSATATANARTHAQAGVVTQPTPLPTQVPTANPAANPVASATSEHPVPTATPDLNVLVVSGNGSKSTATFTVHNTWQVSWNCTDDIAIFFYDAHTNDYADDGPIQFDCSTSNGDSSIYHDSGSFYFNVISSGTWNITVTDLPN